MSTPVLDLCVIVECSARLKGVADALLSAIPALQCLSWPGAPLKAVGPESAAPQGPTAVDQAPSNRFATCLGLQRGTTILSYLHRETDGRALCATSPDSDAISPTVATYQWSPVHVLDNS